MTAGFDHYAHLDHIARQAGLEVMDGTDGVMGVLADRETVSQAQFLTLTPGDITALYEDHIAPAIDRIETELRRRR